MLSMQPINEQDVIALINDDRFTGDVEGYVMTNSGEYLGHALFKVEDNVTFVLDSGVEEMVMLDGIVRACIASGENRGAKDFKVNKEHPPLAKWWDIYCKNFDETAPTDHLFTFC